MEIYLTNTDQKEKKTDINKLFDLDGIKEDFNNTIKDRENEHDLLLENNLIDPSIVLSLQYSVIKLDTLLNDQRYRIFFLSTCTAKLNNIVNCYLGGFFLPKLNNIIVVIQDCEDTIQLWRCQIDIKNGIEFLPKSLVCKGDTKAVIDNLIEFDKDCVHSSQIVPDQLSSFVYILKIPGHFHENINKYTELLVFPALSFNNNIKANVISRILELDGEKRSESDNYQRTSLEKEIIAKTKIEMRDDLYFKHHIFGRGLRQNVIINVITPENIILNHHMDLLDVTRSFSSSILRRFLIIDNSDTLSPSFASILSNNMKVSFSSEKSKEKEALELYINLTNDNKILPERRLEFAKKYITKIIASSCKDPNLNVNFLSSSQTLLYRINERYHEYREEYFRALYLENTENTIYDTYEDYKESKLNYLIKKADIYDAQFFKFEAKIAEFLKNLYYGEINHFYTACLRYSMIMNDLLNIQANQFKEFDISDQLGLEAVIIVYKKVIEAEYEDYQSCLICFQEGFIQGFEAFTQNRIKSIDKWYDSIILPTSAKVDDLTSLFQELLDEMKVRLENFVDEVIGADVRLLIAIKDRLKETGYLNDFIVKYLSNIQSSLMCELNNYDQAFKKVGNEMVLNLCMSGGIGIAGSLLGLGIGRIITAITADAITGSIAGPVGTITGATVGALSLVGSSAYHYKKYKNSLQEKYVELMILYRDYKQVLNEKLFQFLSDNKDEINKRLRSMISYIEYSLRKSFKF